MPLERIDDSIKFARELALDLKYRDKSDSELEVNAAVEAMNQHLFATKGLLPIMGAYSTTLRTKDAFLDLPDPSQNTERLARAPLMSSRIEKVTVEGSVHSFRWLVSSGLALFGIQLYDVNVLPHNITSQNAFVPVLSVEE